MDLDELNGLVRELKTAVVTAIKKYSDKPGMSKADKDELGDLFEILADYLDNVDLDMDFYDVKRRARRLLALYGVRNPFATRV